MYENDTQYKTVSISATITSDAKDYVNQLIKEERERTFTNITFSGMLNKLILLHKRENENRTTKND